MVLIRETNPEFKASRGWAQKFMKRHSLVLRAKTSLSQKLPADLETHLTSFAVFIQRQRLEYNFEMKMIGNMDETPVYFDIVPNKTIDQRGVRSVQVKTTGGDKRHITVVLTCTADGQLPPPMVIFKGKRQLNLRAPPGFIIAVQEKAWMDAALMSRYIREIWFAYTKRSKSLLVLDSFKCHISDEAKNQIKRGNSIPAVIPGGCTSKLQPLDVSINRPFKAILRNQWQQYMMNWAANNDQGKPKPVDKQTILDWIINAYEYIKARPEMIKKSFKVTGISTALDGSENELIRNDNLVPVESAQSEAKMEEASDDIEFIDDTESEADEDFVARVFGDTDDESEFEGF